MGSLFFFAICVASFSIRCTTVGGTAAVSKIESFISQYISKHGREAVFGDGNICSRRFVLGNYACPYMVGRNTHEFLNAVVAAMVIDRTLVWQYCPRKPCSVDDEETCARYMTRSTWIPSIEEVEAKFRGANCSSQINRNHQLIVYAMRHWQERKLACCGIDQLNATLVNFGVFFDRREMSVLSLPFAQLGNDSKQRASILFSLGEDAAYGYVLRSVFQFTDAIKSQNSAPLLAAPNNTLYIGLHLRHSSSSEEGAKELAGEKQCLEQTIKFAVLGDGQNKTTRPCVVLVASDRFLSLDRVRQTAMQLGCTAVVTNHTAIKKSYGEHGPYWGEIAMLDMELLSHAEYFIGSSYIQYSHLVNENCISSYSMLVAALVASKSGYQHSPEERVRWLPFCGKASIGRHYTAQGEPHSESSALTECVRGLLIPNECTGVSNVTRTEFGFTP